MYKIYHLWYYELFSTIVVRNTEISSLLKNADKVYTDRMNVYHNILRTRAAV